MSSEAIVARLRTFLLILTVVVCAGTAFELVLLEHTDEPIQLVPFVLAGVAAGLSLWVLFKPSRLSIRALRVGMGGVVVGSLVGVILHFTHNLELELEMRPNAGVGDVLWQTLTGANPLLSPGVLALVGVLAIAATYYHPARQNA